MEPGDRRWALGWISLVVVVVAAFLALLLRPWGKTTHLGAAELTAIVGFAGVFYHGDRLANRHDGHATGQPAPQPGA